MVVLGYSAPLSPTLSDFGFDAVPGTRVIDDDLVLESVNAKKPQRFCIRLQYGTEIWSFTLRFAYLGRVLRGRKLGVLCQAKTSTLRYSFSIRNFVDFLRHKS